MLSKYVIKTISHGLWLDVIFIQPQTMGDHIYYYYCMVSEPWNGCMILYVWSQSKLLILTFVKKTKHLTIVLGTV